MLIKVVQLARLETSGGGRRGDWFSLGRGQCGIDHRVTFLSVGSCPSDRRPL